MVKNELNRLANELRIYNDANLQDDWLLGLEQALRSLAALGAVPEGFVLVPARPTHAMREAAYKWHTTEYVSDPMGERNRFYGGIYSAMLAAAPQPAGEAVEMSPEFTDSARGAIAWVLWHHQGGHSPIGQPLRFALGMGAGESLPEHLIADAKRWAESVGATSDEFHRYRALPEPAPSAPADVEALQDGERFAFLVSRWHKGTGIPRPSTPADEAILNALITGDMPAIRLVIDNVRCLFGAQHGNPSEIPKGSFSEGAP